MVQMTDRDWNMLEWLDTVGFADLQAIRWAMSGTAGRTDGEPVALRKAQRWMLRMHTIGVIRRGVPAFQSGAVMWATERASGRKPNIYRQTARHELAVARVSAHYLSLGYEWKRDRPPTSSRDHQADGVATRGDEVVLVEVELTTKTKVRYGAIHNSNADRLQSGEATRVDYFCPPSVARMVAREADRMLIREIRNLLHFHSVLDGLGKWACECSPHCS
jgi:hypothetical protein